MKTAGEALIRELTDVARSQQNDFERFAWRCLAVRGFQPQREDVEDALSDAYLIAATRIRNEPALRIPNLPAWFRRVLFFACLKKVDRKRSLGITEEIEALEFEDSQVRSNPDWDSPIFVRDLLEKLEPKERAVLGLLAQGETSGDIAGKLNLSAENVRQIKSRGIRSLRRIMDGKR
jgi:RNA polymerase sigma factor (sigma-70 family)